MIRCCYFDWLAKLRLAPWLAAVVALLAGPACASEAALRAAFVLNFIKFIEWPLVEEEGVFRLCVLAANDDMRLALSPLHGRAAAKSKIDLVHLPPDSLGAKLKSCQMLYLAGKNTVNLPLPLPPGLVLVVNSEELVTPSTSIALLNGDNGRLEFIVNQNAVLAAGVIMSSQLLKLASNRPLKGIK
jgi:hypothetical protein